MRYGLQNTVIWPQDAWALPINETFLSNNLQDAGYYTAYFGKVRDVPSVSLSMYLAAMSDRLYLKLAANTSLARSVVLSIGITLHSMQSVTIYLQLAVST